MLPTASLVRTVRRLVPELQARTSARHRHRPGLLLGALLLCTAAPRLASQDVPCAADTEERVARAWRAYRADSATVALTRFEQALRRCPANDDAEVGRGFAALRLGRLAEAETAFRLVTSRNDRYVDAWDGLALVSNRRGDLAAALLAWRRVVAIEPAHHAARAQLDRLAPDWEREAAPLHRRRSPALDLTMRVRGRRFEQRRGDDWVPFYIRGVNLGAALPGRFPAEFPTDSALYARWLDQIAAMHANTVRVYTVLPPAFYRALRAHNLRHPGAPLHLLHGVWTELPPADNFDDPGFLDDFRREIRDVIDLLHGAAQIAPRPGHASGRYDADVSPWVIGYIVGREWEPYSAIEYNERVGRPRRHDGRFVAIGDAPPLDAWMVAQCDYLMAYEHDTYHAQRPVAYTNWPTTDPIVHRSEVGYEEQMRMRGVRYDRAEDAPPIHEEEGVGLDPSLARAGAENAAGWFASYHVYPYYPDFMLYDPVFAAARSSLGPSNYFGYLQALLAHHHDIPVLIAEFGLPSSRGNAHLQPQGWHHGGLDEQQVADGVVRLAREIEEAGAAGAIVFAWIDEWFKRSWISADFELPSDRGRLWHSMLSPEQHYGLVALRPGAPGVTPEPGGDVARWRAHATYLEGALFGRERSTVRVGADEGYVYLSIETPGRAGRPFPWDSVALQIGIDTYRADLGQSALPTSGIRSSAGFEFLVELRDTADAQLMVVPDYNLYMPERLAQGGDYFGAHFRRSIVSVPRRDALFDTMYVLTNRPRFTPDARLIPGTGLNVGRLQFGRAAHRSNADWFHDEASGMLQLRLPWGMLNVADPSSRRVLWERKEGQAGETSTFGGATHTTSVPTDGFRFGFASIGPGPLVTGALPALDPYGNWLGTALPLWTWPSWEQPTWHERPKPVYAALRALWGGW